MLRGYPIEAMHRRRSIKRGKMGKGQGIYRICSNEETTKPREIGGPKTQENRMGKGGPNVANKQRKSKKKKCVRHMAGDIPGANRVTKLEQGNRQAAEDNTEE